jgi:hypothetical protein
MSEINKKLQELYAQGLNDYEVASVVHLGRDRLRNWREFHNIKSKTNKKGLSDDLCDSILNRLSVGESLCSIGLSLNINRSSVTRLLKRNGYKTGFRSRPVWTMNYKLTEIQESVLIGEMFGDGGLVKSGPETAYYQCGHSIRQKLFVDWKFDIFSPLSCRKKEDGKKITMATWSSGCLFSYWKWFYPSGKGNKIILPEMVARLNWMGVAVWFMGDGTRDRQQVRFSVGKQQNLNPIVDVMNQKFGNMFEAKFYNREWFLKIRDNENFFKQIAPFLLPCFAYKIPACK